MLTLILPKIKQKYISVPVAVVKAIINIQNAQDYQDAVKK